MTNRRLPPTAVQSTQDPQLGIQGLSLRSHVWTFVDGPGIRWQLDTGPVRHYLNWFKAWEGADHQSDDSDLYAYRAILSLPDFPLRPGGFVAYMHQKDDPIGFGLGRFRAGITDSRFDADYYWLGVNVDGKIGPVNLQTDFIYFGGEAEATGLGKLEGFGDFDYGGWLAWIDANLDLDVGMPGLNVGGTFMYATGDDLSEFNKLSPDVEGYRVPPATEGNPLLSVVFWPSAVHDTPIRRTCLARFLLGSRPKLKPWKGQPLPTIPVEVGPSNPGTQSGRVATAPTAISRRGSCSTRCCCPCRNGAPAAAHPSPSGYGSPAWRCGPRTGPGLSSR